VSQSSDNAKVSASFSISLPDGEAACDSDRHVVVSLEDNARIWSFQGVVGLPSPLLLVTKSTRLPEESIDTPGSALMGMQFVRKVRFAPPLCCSIIVSVRSSVSASHFQPKYHLNYRQRWGCILSPKLSDRRTGESSKIHYFCNCFRDRVDYLCIKAQANTSEATISTRLANVGYKFCLLTLPLRQVRTQSVLWQQKR